MQSSPKQLNDLAYPLRSQKLVTELARRIRRHTLDMVNRARSSHIGTCFSMAEILAVLYGRILRLDSKSAGWSGRDRFILSKGHGCAALYAALAERGFFPRDWLDTFYQDGSRLVGHATHTNVPGVEISSGSLGHGLSMACGMALVGKREGRSCRFVVLLSDGECDEGSVWEAAMFGGFHKLNNLLVIVDYNKIQSIGRTEEVLDLEPFGDKWRSCRWNVSEVDGHDPVALEDVFSRPWAEREKPDCVIAHTVKGKGVTFMENQLLWHYRAPNQEEYGEAVKQLDGHQ